MLRHFRGLWAATDDEELKVSMEMPEIDTGTRC
jgi:hypothetical protein